jgi:maleylacetoacetate isomerase
MALQLYSFWRSSAAYRVRIALHHKGLPFETVAKHLVRDGGEQRKADYLAVNPQGLVPALADDGHVIPQSLAICEYLEETHPEPRLLPGNALDRAAIRSLALAVACDIHPLNNLSVTAYVRSQFGADDAAVQRWIAHWIQRGLGAVEERVRRLSGDGRHCHGSSVTLADVFLVPQMYNARRFKVDVTTFPTLVAVCAHLETLPAFSAARPEVQPDAE